MPPATAPRPRSGCALVAGILLIATGTLLLARNLFGASPLGLLVPVLGWLAVYWPGILIAWGAYKIYQRMARPETARVSGLEILVLFFILVLGLGLRAGRHLAAALELDEMRALTGAGVLDPVHRFVEERRFDVGEDETALTVVNDRGAVRVRGWDDPGIQATLTKHVRHANEVEASRMAETVDVVLTAGAEDGELRLSRSRGGPGHDVELELELLVPRRLSLVIRNGRGSVRVYDADGTVTVETTDDAIEIENVSGDVEASTTHGPLRLDRLAGSVQARNRHGSITASRIEGDLAAETRNGTVRLEDVRGAATVRNRHAAVRVHRIGGDLRIDAPHSEIDVEEASSRVAIETSNRAVFVRDVEGPLGVDARNATITVRGARAGTNVQNRYRPVIVSDAVGPVAIDAPQSAVVVESVRGSVVIHNSHESVTVSGVLGALDVRSAHAPVRVASPRVEGDLRVHTSYGDVELRLPPMADARYELRARSGELRAEGSTFQWTESETDEGMLWIRHGQSEDASGRSVVVVTSYGDIILREPAH